MKQQPTREDEQFISLTARYVMECEEGRRPQIREYIQSYPQYAEALADFAAYYHTIEIPLSSIATGNEELPTEKQNAQRAARKASGRVYTAAQTQQPIAITTLLMTAENVPLSLNLLATRLSVSEEIVQQLEQQAIEANSIPLNISRELALLLHIPVSTIQQYFLLDKRQQTTHNSEKNVRVAEPVPTYPIAIKQTFLQTIEESTTMPEAQKMVWREIVAEEQKKRATDDV